MDHELKPYDAMTDDDLKALVSDRTGMHVSVQHRPAQKSRAEESFVSSGAVWAASNTLHRALAKLALKADALPPRYREVEEFLGWKRTATDCGMGWWDPKTDHEYGHGASVDDLLTWLRGEGWRLDEAFSNGDRYLVAVRSGLDRITGHGDTFLDAVENVVRLWTDQAS